MESWLLADQLEHIKKQHLYRSRKVIDGPQGACIQMQGRSLLNFSSNDYLGLANHPAVKKAFISAVEKYGVGSGSAHLICGHSSEHHALEEELAEFTGRSRALVFSTGYMANVGILSALLNKQDEVFEDRLNHASLIDGGLMSGARFRRYSHNDMTRLQQLLDNSKASKKVIVSDGIFSMDGDEAPMTELVALADKYQAALMIDDAHGMGVLGDNGAGLLDQCGLNQQQVPILMATLGKALGTFGAFVAGSESLIEFLIQHARSYIYTTAPPPAVMAATRVSLKLCQQESWRREKLNALIQQFRQGAQQLGLSLLDSSTAIQPIIFADNEKTVKASQYLMSKGFLVSAIRSPTVPKGSERLRITLSAEHTETQVNALLDVLAELPR